MNTKNQILKQSAVLLNDLQAVCNDFNFQQLTKILNGVKNFAEKNQYLDVAVLGQFKAGKSSFLNSYFGKSLLPTGNIPVTSVITRVKYGSKENAEVLFKDGASKLISIASIKEFISETNNPGNKKNVGSVDIELPVLSDIKELRLVDTPGIGSVWKHNTETTKDWFPETGCVLFVIGAEKPVSENELNLLKEIYSYSTEIAVIITKTDLFKVEQIAEIEAFTFKVLNEAFPKSFPVLRYSTVKNTVSFNEQIRQRIFSPLAENKDKVYAEILHHKINSLADTCLSYLHLSYEASLKKEDEKTKLKDAIIDEHLNLEFVRKELLLILTSYKEKTRDSLEEYLNSFKKQIIENICKEYEIAFGRWKGNLYQRTRQFETWLKGSLESSLKEIMLQETKSFELLSALKKHLSFYLKSFRERLNGNIERILSVQMKPEEWSISLSELSKPGISISRTFDSHIDLLWFLFPMVLFRKIFRKYFLRQIPYEVENNLYRLTSDLNGKLSAEMDKLMSQSLEYINCELTTIDSLLSEKNGDSQSMLNRIETIKKRLKEFQAHEMAC